MKMTRYIFYLFLIPVLFSSQVMAQGSRQIPVIKIGMIIDGPWSRNAEIQKLFQQEIVELTRGEFDVRFPSSKQIESDWTLKGISGAIDRLLADRNVDMIITLGGISSQIVSRKRNLLKPVIAPFIFDAEFQKLPMRKGTSGVKNLYYVNFSTSFRREVEVFLEVVSFQKLVLLINRFYLDAIPDIATHIQKSLEELDLELYLVPVGRSAEEALARIPSGTEAVYVAPLFHLPQTEMDQLVTRLKEERLPSFSHLGRKEVEGGILAGLKSDFFPKLSRRVALNVQRVLLGEDAGSLPVRFSMGEKLTINMATARAIDVYPNWSVLTEAELVQQVRKEIERVLDLKKAVDEALSQNLDLVAKGRFVKAGAQDVKKAWSALFPHLTLSGQGVVIDEDRAEASFGQQAEQTLSGSISATQIIFSEPAWANLSIQKHIQKSREAEHDRLRLDIIQAAATSYLNVLRTKTFERIQNDNLKRTRTNLELARVREAIGSAGPAEVYRWESQIASNLYTNPLRDTFQQRRRDWRTGLS
jgi:ABC-type uncharacterized transport system substrate-binding protein